MKKTGRTAVACLALLLSSGTITSGHHSQAIFDLDNQINLEGRIVQVNWGNPHSLFFLEGKKRSDHRQGERQPHRQADDAVEGSHHVRRQGLADRRAGQLQPSVGRRSALEVMEPTVRLVACQP